MTSRQEIQAQIDEVVFLVKQPNGVSLAELCKHFDIGMYSARHRLEGAEAILRLYSHQSRDGTNFGERRYFASIDDLNRYIAHGPTANAAPTIPRQGVPGSTDEAEQPAPRQRQKAGPRTFTEPVSAPPSFINPSPAIRPGALDARGYPSRRGNVLVYPDGTTERIDNTAHA